LLANNPAAAEIVLGGGVALSHYLDYRETHDLDAWWASGPNAEIDRLLSEAMRTVAARHGLALTRRTWGETTSLELVAAGRKVFSLRIASRDRWLDAPLAAAWSPVRIETLRDNAAAKMTALVERGAPATGATSISCAITVSSASMSAGLCRFCHAARSFRVSRSLAAAR
jgi:hypothetical protein